MQEFFQPIGGEGKFRDFIESIKPQCTGKRYLILSSEHYVIVLFENNQLTIVSATDENRMDEVREALEPLSTNFVIAPNAFDTGPKEYLSAIPKGSLSGYFVYDPTQAILKNMHR